MPLCVGWRRLSRDRLLGPRAEGAGGCAGYQRVIDAKSQSGSRRRLGLLASLKSLDYSLLMPGDLAVTADGDHVMAYLGNQTWIAADPGVGKVTTFTIPEHKNAYFSTPMRVVRWKILNK